MNEGRIYVGDGEKQLKVLTKKDLTNATDYGLKFEKPDGTTGQVATEDGVTLHESGKAIIYDVDDDTFFDQAGLWKFQAFAIFDGTTLHGDPVKVKVHESISV